jgi:hypothetical protein
MRKARRLVLEHLEDRRVPTTFGIPWPDPQHLTLSFVPDGTAAGGVRSGLFQALDGTAARGDWQREVLRAFQTWAVNANLNIGVVADGGQPLGATGAVQGDPRFGDIRLAGGPAAPGTLATNSPFSWSGTTWSGDVLVNTLYNFGIGDNTGKYDLFSAMLDEAGNVLGLADNDGDTGSALYGGYVGVRAGLSASDVQAVQALYGPRTPDAWEGSKGNDTPATAARLNLAQGSAVVNADVTTTSDVDYYTFSLPGGLNAGGFTVQVKTAGISLLVPAVTVYDATGQVVGSAAASDPLNGNLTVPVSATGSQKNFVVKVTSAVGNVFGVGAYQLTVTAGGAAFAAPPSAAPASDGYTNDQPAQASPLNARPGTADGRFDYFTTAALSDAQDVDWYRVKAQAADPQAAQTLAALVWATGGSTLAPQLEVFDAAGRPVPFQVVANQNGTFSVQVTGVAANANYLLKVSPLQPGGSQAVGNYALAADFYLGPPMTLTPLVGDTLTPGAAPESLTMTAGRNQLYEFALAADAVSAAGWWQVQMTLSDAAGNVVATLTAGYGQVPVSTVVYLPAGTYSLQFSAAGPAGPVAAPAPFRLSDQSLSDPIGPQLINTTTMTSGSPSTGSGGLTLSKPTSPTSGTTVGLLPPYFF